MLDAAMALAIVWSGPGGQNSNWTLTTLAQSPVSSLMNLVVFFPFVIGGFIFGAAVSTAALVTYHRDSGRFSVHGIVNGVWLSGMLGACLVVYMSTLLIRSL